MPTVPTFRARGTCSGLGTASELTGAEPGWTGRLACVQPRQHLALMAMFDDDWGSTQAVRTLVVPFRRTTL